MDKFYPVSIPLQFPQTLIDKSYRISPTLPFPHTLDRQSLISFLLSWRSLIALIDKSYLLLIALPFLHSINRQVSSHFCRTTIPPQPWWASLTSCLLHCRSLIALSDPFQWRSWKTVISSYKKIKILKSCISGKKIHNQDSKQPVPVLFCLPGNVSIYRVSQKRPFSYFAP